MEKLKEVEIGGKKLPIKCNIDCLIAIQDEFEDFKTFEQGLIGIKKVNDEIKYSTPKLESIKTALPMFIKCGLDEWEEQGKKAPEIDYFKAINDVDFNIIETAIMLYEEFTRCFYRKKSIPQKSTMSESSKRAKAR